MSSTISSTNLGTSSLIAEDTEGTDSGGDVSESADSGNASSDAALEKFPVSGIAGKQSFLSSVIHILDRIHIYCAVWNFTCKVRTR